MATTASSRRTRLARLTTATAVAAALAACDPGGDTGTVAGTPAPPDTATSGPASPTATATASATATATAPARSGRLGEPVEIARGLDVPWGTTFLPTGEALVAERDTGRILQIPARGGTPRAVATVPGVDPGGEGGLLGIAASPTYRTDRWLYAYFTAADDNRIARFRLAPDGGRPTDVRVVLAGIAKAGYHNGGRIAFGPDGMLYAGTGDAGDTASSQDRASLNGKILRMTPEGRPAPGNPVAGSVVYSWGHRNVQGLAWDSQRRLWATEFGQNTTDEVNLIRPGRNYGWPQVEGAGDTAGGRYTDPVVTWRTSEASPSGAAVVPGRDGDTLYVAALRGQRLWRVPLNRDGSTGRPEPLHRDVYGRIRTVTLAPDGALWMSTSNRDSNGEPGGRDDRVLRLPPA